MQSEPVAERAGIVTVACASAVWAQELDLLSERVVERLNAELGRPAVQGLRPQARAAASVSRTFLAVLQHFRNTDRAGSEGSLC